MKKDDSLSDIFLFENLSSRELKKIQSFAKKVSIKKKTTLFTDEDPANSFFYLVSGGMKVYKVSPNGLEQTLHINKPGDLIGEAAIFGKGTYPASCVALKNSVLIQILKNDFFALIEDNPKISLKLMAAYSKKLRGFVSIINDLSLRDVKGRLANYIIRTSKDECGNLITRLNVSKRDLASAIGTIPETLSRTLNLFKKEKVLEVNGDILKIVDLEGLKKYLK